MNRLHEDASRAYEVLCAGGLVLLPTDVGFGLVGCSDDAVARIYELKGRPRGKPCVTVADMRILDDVAALADTRVRAWIDAVREHTPIAIVNRVRPGSTLLSRLSPYVLGHATTHGTIATFLNAGALVDRIAVLALADERIVVGSSANVAFTGNNYALEDVPTSIRDRVDLVVEGPRARYHNPDRLATTVLDLTRGEFLRVGIQYDLIAASWRDFHDSAVRSAV